MTDVTIDTWTEQGMSLLPEMETEVLDPTIIYDPSCKPEVIDSEMEVLTPNVATDAGIASVGTGGDMLWSDTATWIGGVVPIDGNAVAIALGDTVHLDIDMAAYTVGLDGLVIHGELRFATASPITGTLLIPSSLTPSLAIKEGTTISGEGSLFVGNSDADQLTMAPIGAGYRSAIRFMGTPLDEMITVTTCEFHGWYDVLNQTTLAAAALIGENTITLTDNLLLTQGDIIAIANGYTQGALAESQLGRYTVATYDASTKTVTLAEDLCDSRLAGDCVAHISRPILISAAASFEDADIAVFAENAVNDMTGVWFTGGSHIADSFDLDYTLIGCTMEGNYTPAMKGVLGNVIFTNCTVLNPLTDTSSGGLCDLMQGTVFVRDSAIIGGNVGLSYTAGLQANNLIIMNAAITGLNEMRSSLFRSCVITGCNKGSVNGGQNRYIGCTLNNSIADMDGEYQAEAYRLIFGNPLTLGLSLGVHQQLWYSNCSIDHNGQQGFHRTWCAGGYGVVQDLITYMGNPTWQFTINTANLPIFWDTEFLGAEGVAFTVSAAIQKDFLGGTVAFQIIDPSADPLYGFGDSALSETLLPDEISHWRVLSLSYTPSVTTPLIARIFVQNVTAEGNVYAYSGGLDAIQITGDSTIVSSEL